MTVFGRSVLRGFATSASLCAALAAGAASAQTVGLSITDTGFDPIPAGGTIDYAVRLQNSGNAVSLADTLTFTVPAGSTYTGLSGGLTCSPDPVQVANAEVVCTVPALAPQAILNAIIQIRPSNSGTIMLSGKLGSAARPVEQTTTVNRGADLALDISGPVTVQAGRPATVTAVITNNGPHASESSTVTLSLPAELAEQVVLPGGCSILGSEVTCTLGAIAVNGSQTLTFPTKVTSGFGNVTVTGSVQGQSPVDPAGVNNSDAFDMLITPGTDVFLGKSRSPSGLVFLGEDVTFTLTPQFHGDTPLSATITDNLPGEYELVSVTASGTGWTCPEVNPVICTYSSGTADPAGFRAPITIVATPVAQTTQPHRSENTAVIASQGDVDPTNNSASDGGADISEPTFDLVAVKGVPPHGLVVIGQEYAWTLSTYNQGLADFRGRLEFTERVPAGLRVRQIQTPAGWICDSIPEGGIAGPAEILCYTDHYLTTPLANDRSPTPPLTVIAMVTGTGVDGTEEIANGLLVGFSDETYRDINMGNNEVAPGVTSGNTPNIADLTIAKAVVSASSVVESGADVTFEVTLINNGPVEALNVRMTDRLADLYYPDAGPSVTVNSMPAGMTCQTDRNGFAYTDLNCLMDSVPVCGTAAPTVSCPVVSFTARVGDVGQKRNTAEAYSLNTPDANYGNNSAYADYEVLGKADVKVEKLASHVNGSDVNAGEELIYTIAVSGSNQGLSPAEAVTLTDKLPAGLKILSVQHPGITCDAVTNLDTKGLTTASSELNCQLGTLLDNQTRTITVRTVPHTSLKGGDITNTATVATTVTPEITTSNNTSSITHRIVDPSIDLVTNKTVDALAVQLNELARFTITVQNDGPSDAFDVVITDSLPATGLSYHSFQTSTPGLTCTQPLPGSVGESLVCNLSHLRAREVATLQVNMTAEELGSWTNEVEARSAEYADEVQKNNNRADSTVNVYDIADLQITKQPSLPTVDLGQSFNWVIEVTNTIGFAQGVVVTDQLPSNMTVNGTVTTTAGSCSVSGRNLTCNLPDMPTGTSHTITVPVMVNAVTQNPQEVKNTASVSTISFEQHSSDNTATGLVNVVTAPISGTVWRDFNADNTRDRPTEVDRGLSGVTVNLSGGTNPATGQAYALSTTTDSNGQYIFGLLPPGSYRVWYNAPDASRYSPQASFPGSSGGIGGTEAAALEITGITHVRGAGAVNNDFSLWPLARIAMAKQGAVSGAPNSDGSFNVVYTFRIRNLSEEPLKNVVIRDNLLSGFGAYTSAAEPGPGQYTVSVPASPGLANPGFNGLGDKLVTSDLTIEPDAIQVVTMTLRVNPPFPLPASSITLINNGSTAGQGEYSGQLPVDNSTDGATPQIGNPSNTQVPLPFTPGIRLDKTINTSLSRLNTPPAVDNVVIYDFTVTNTGNTRLTAVSISDTLAGLDWIAEGPIDLDVGASSTPGQFQARYVLKQEDLERGSLVNTAIASGRWGSGTAMVVTDSDTATLSSLAVPSIDVLKSADATDIENPTVVGQEIHYSFRVTNTGNVMLRNVVLTDSLPGLVEDPEDSFDIGELAPGDHVDLEGIYKVTLADINAGRVLNTASASGLGGDQTIRVSDDSDTVTTPLFPNPSFWVSKVIGTGPEAVPEEGDEITWLIEVHNTGNTSLVINTVTESLSNVTLTYPGSLLILPGDSLTIEASYDLTQANIDAGSITNQVLVSTTVPGNPGISVSSVLSGDDDEEKNTRPTVTPLNPDPAITLVKSLVTAPLPDPVLVGTELEYSFTIANAGNVTLTDLTLVEALPGAKIVPADLTALQNRSLAPNQNVVLTAFYTVTQEDILAREIRNSAITTGTAPNEREVEDTSGTDIDNDDATVTELLQRPALQLEKTITARPAEPMAEGNIVTYGFRVTNTGNVPLENLSITDAVAGVAVTGSRSTPLLPGQSDDSSFTATYALTEADILARRFTNTATATAEGLKDGSNVEVSDTDEAELLIAPDPRLVVVKTADSAALQDPPQPEDVITYSFTITNTGNIGLTNVVLADPLPGLELPVTIVASLGAHQSVTLTGTYKITAGDLTAGLVENRASVTADYVDPDTGMPGSLPPVSSDLVEVPLDQAPGIKLVKTADETDLGSPARPEQEIRYSFTVTNTGNVDLRDVVVSDTLPGLTPDHFDIASLLIGQSVTVGPAVYEIDQDDINAGFVENRALATGTWGTSVDPKTVSDDSETDQGVDGPTVTELETEPSIALVKLLDPSIDPATLGLGDTLRWTFLVKNTGNVTLEDISITESLPDASVTGGPISLDPGEEDTTSFTAEYEITLKDLNAGFVRNSATVTGTYDDGTNTPEEVSDVSGGTLTDDDPTRTPLTQSPGIEVVKSADPSGLSDPIKLGDAILYSFEVTNTGDVTLHDVELTDSLPGLTAVPDGSFSIGELAPGANTTVYGSYPVRLGDINATRVLNTATVDAEAGDQRDPISADSNAVTTHLVPTPAFWVSKVIDKAPTALPKEGDEVTWLIEVNNSGNTSLTIGTVTESLQNTTVSAPVDAEIGPGESTTLSVSYILTQDDIDAGLITNQVTVAASIPPVLPGDSPIPVPSVVSGDDDEEANTRPTETPLHREPAITLVKTMVSTPSDPAIAGEVLDYEFTITNTGNVTLRSLTLEDLLVGAQIDTGDLSWLAFVDWPPGSGTTIPGTYAITPEDIAAGFVRNSAIATGTAPDGEVVKDTSGTAADNDDATVTPLGQNPAILLEKTITARPAEPMAEGDIVTYGFRITNTGNVPLTNLVLSDVVQGVTVTGSRSTPLLAGEVDDSSFTATYALTEADILARNFTNTAEVRGSGAKNGSVEVVSATDDAELRILPNPRIAVVKTADSSALKAPPQPGDVITYSFTITNTGNIGLTNIVLADPLPGLDLPVRTVASLGAHQSVTLNGTYRVTAGDLTAGLVENQASVTADYVDPDTSTPGSLPPVSSELVEVPLDQVPGIRLVKTAYDSAVSSPALPDQEIRYWFTVENTGNVDLRDLLVTDPLTGLAPGSYQIPRLLIGETALVGPAIYKIDQGDIDAGFVENRAHATGTWGPAGDPGTVSDDSVTDSWVDGPTVTKLDSAPAIALVKMLDPSINPAVLGLGDTLRWTFRVVNTGNVTLEGITIAESLAGATVSGGPVTLAPGAVDTASFTAEYRITQSDLDAGFVRNSATVTGIYNDGTNPPREVSDLSGGTVTDDEPTRTPLTQGPAIALVKVADASGLSKPVRPGDLIRYSFTVTNTGDVTLTDIVLTDSLQGVVLSGGPIASLAPGAVDRTSFTAVYALTQADIDAGKVENSALVTGSWTDGVTGNPGSVSDVSGGDNGTDTPTVVELDADPGLSLVKTAVASALSVPAAPGEFITFHFAITNTGNVTMTNVVIDDPMPGLVLSGQPIASIAPGETSTAIFGTYPITAEDIIATRVINTARAGGDWSSGGSSDHEESNDSTVQVPLGYPEIGFNITVGELRDLNGDGIMGPGDEVVFRFEVINTGTVPLNGVDLDYSSLSLSLPGLVCRPISLAVGERAFLECTGAAYRITEADAATGQISLTGTASGTSDAGVVVNDSSTAPAVTGLAQGGLSVTKLAGVETAMIGDLVPYTITIANGAQGVPVTARVADLLPAGFLYREGSARLDGVAVTPVISGRSLVVEPVTVDPGQTRVLVMNLLVGSSVKPGAHTNTVRLVNPVTGTDIAEKATATVRVLADAVMQCATVLGRVFDDTDQNGHMSKSAEERGLPNVRLIAPNGLAITTDEHGRFNVPCAALPQAIGSNFMLKLDERTLPAGYRLTTENPRVVRLTPGMITRLDFGATMARLVRIDLAANAFTDGGLSPGLEAGLKKMVEQIRDTATMLRISYVLTSGEDESNAKSRLRQVEKAVRKLWSGTGKYKLNIETVIERAGVAQ